MEHSAKKLSKVCAPEHKQNAKILNMINTFKEDIQKVHTGSRFIWWYGKYKATQK